MDLHPYQFTKGFCFITYKNDEFHSFIMVTPDLADKKYDTKMGLDLMDVIKNWINDEKNKYTAIVTVSDLQGYLTMVIGNKSDGLQRKSNNWDEAMSTSNKVIMDLFLDDINLLVSRNKYVPATA